MSMEIGGQTPDTVRPTARQTPEDLRKAMDKAINLFCNEFVVYGKKEVDEAREEGQNTELVDGKNEIKAILEKNPKTKFVVAASHFSNLDAPAAVRALGDILDIQITAESVLFKGLAPQRVLFKWAGEGNFVPLSYERGKRGKHGVLNPDDFTKLSASVEKGKTPWIAIHPFTKGEEMQDARIGSVYLAHKSGSMIIPTALEYEGGSVSLEGGLELVKALASRVAGKGRAKYHIGKPIELPPLDVSIIEIVLNKRKNGETTTAEENNKFFAVLKILRQEAHLVANKIAEMLPLKHQGVYREVELDEKDLKEI